MACLLKNCRKFLFENKISKNNFYFFIELRIKYKILENVYLF